MFRKTLLGALGGAALIAAAPGDAPEVGAHLSQVREFAASEGERVWPGYGTAPFGFLLVTEREESLLCRDQVPEGFTAAGTDPATGCERHVRPRSGLPADRKSVV